jgi:uncharacterized membrane protein
LSSIDWLGDAVRMLAAFPSSDRAWQTNLGEIRLIGPPLPFGRIVRDAFDLVRQAGAANPAVTIRLLQTCARLVPQLRDEEQRSAIHNEVEAIHEAAVHMLGARIDRNEVENAYRLACERLGAGGTTAASTEKSR